MRNWLIKSCFAYERETLRPTTKVSSSDYNADVTEMFNLHILNRSMLQQKEEEEGEAEITEEAFINSEHE